MAWASSLGVKNCDLPNYLHAQSRARQELLGQGSWVVPIATVPAGSSSLLFAFARCFGNGIGTASSCVDSSPRHTASVEIKLRNRPGFLVVGLGVRVGVLVVRPRSLLSFICTRFVLIQPILHIAASIVSGRKYLTLSPDLLGFAKVSDLGPWKQENFSRGTCQAQCSRFLSRTPQSPPPQTKLCRPQEILRSISFLVAAV